MLDSNYLIINRKPQRFSQLKIAGKTAVFFDADGKPLDYGVISLDDSVYAVLYCEEVCNITLVTDKAGIRNVVTILWETEEGYHEGYKKLNGAMKRHFSAQNKKLNRYAEAIVEKLELGIQLKVTDAVDEAQMVVCPECGMLNPAGSEYCLDCGAEI